MKLHNNPQQSISDFEITPDMLAKFEKSSWNFMRCIKKFKFNFYNYGKR